MVRKHLTGYLLDEFPEDEDEAGTWMAGMTENIAIKVVQHVYVNYELTPIEKSVPAEMHDVQNNIRDKLP